MLDFSFTIKITLISFKSYFMYSNSFSFLFSYLIFFIDEK